MGLKPRIHVPAAVGRLRRSRPPHSKRKLAKPRVLSSSHRRRSTHIGGGASVSDKLDALRNLVPSQNAEMINPDQDLFEETADYIVLLKTQVLVLQKLVDLYGSNTPQENQAAAV
ncbi:hypothetical protein ABFS82_08G030000 [Erythranthe guttata]